MRKRLSMFFVAAAMLGILAGCGSSQSGSNHNGSDHADHNHSVVYKDGTFVGRSGPDERGAVGEVAITIEKGKITKADYKGIQKDGKIKDVEYGMTNGKIENQEYYNKAQNALKATVSYTTKLVETQNAAKIDAISGATVSYEQFTEATKKALAQAM